MAGRLVLAATAHAQQRIIDELRPYSQDLAELSRDFTHDECDAITRFLNLVAQQYRAHHA